MHFDFLTSSVLSFSCSLYFADKGFLTNQTILLYNINLEDNNIKMKSLEENEFFCKDPILPRTHDYSCKNPNCITHKKTDVKEAIFYKEKDSFKIKYICCVCYYSW